MSLIFWLFLIVVCDMILREQKPTPARKPRVSMAVPASKPGGFLGCDNNPHVEWKFTKR
jgi:hypothetical protein